MIFLGQSAMQAQSFSGDFVSHIGVAVAVAAHP